MTVERRPAPRRALRAAGRIALVLIVGLPLLVAGTATAGVGLLLFGNLPGTVPEENPREASQPSRVYDVFGNEIAVFREFDLTVPMTKDNVPQVLKDAVIASEDRNFWTHRGIDPEGLFRAALTNYREGTVVQGGSTITQQYVKERYLTSERTISRKLNEAVLATRVERDLADEYGSERAAKEEILFRYLDQTYFGGGAYGAGAAAQTYFRKDITQLTLSEAALLAGVIPAPSKFGPRENFFLAEGRRQDVLKAMLDEQMITQAQFDEAFAQPVWYAGFGFPDGPVTLVHPAPSGGATAHHYFVDYVRRYLEDRYGHDLVIRGGLRIETTIDPFLQQKAEKAVSDNLRGTEYPLEMSLVSIEPSTGHVKAFVGGRDFDASQVNLGLGGSTGMQAGSAFKTFTMAAALEAGFGPETTYPGGPYLEPGCVTAGNVPCAALGGAGGDMRSAAASSSNAYFVQLAEDVGANDVAEVANRLGLSSWMTLDRDYSPRITLGQYSVSPLEMAAGNATLANHGMRPHVTPVVRVTQPDGTLLEDNSTATGTQVLHPAIADTVTDILRGVITNGTGRRADIGRPVAGKTGTADDYRAAWFAGYTPQLATAVWIGYADEPRPMYNIAGFSRVEGGSIPAKTWGEFMRAAHEGLPVIDFPVPGPLPPPRTEGDDEDAAPRRRPNQRSVGTLPRDCGGPCVQSPSLPPPAAPPPPTTTPPPAGPTVPDEQQPPPSSTTTTTEDDE
jgi:penicillin-binding protein 1A